MAKYVGIMHQHDLPDIGDASALEVYRCDGCKREFFRDGDDRDIYRVSKWAPVIGEVEYHVHEDGEPEIGNWTPNPILEGVPDEGNS